MTTSNKTPSSALVETPPTPAGLSNLRRLWRGEPFFVSTQRRSKPDAALRKALQRLPSEWRHGHFGLLTSGTTGAPRLVVGSRSRAIQLAGVLHRLQRLEPVSQTIVLLPLSYSYAFVNQFVWAETHDRALVATPGFTDPPSLHAALSRADQAMICLVGAQASLLRSHFTGDVFPGVIRINFAGGRFPLQDLPRLRVMFPNADFFNNFGCAEAMPRLSIVDLSDADRENGAMNDPLIVGRPLPGVEFSSDAEQALRFRSPYGAVGLVDADSGEARPIEADQWVETGDLAEQLPSGEWRLLGRRGSVLKRHGEKVSLASLRESLGAVWEKDADFYQERDADGELGHVLLLAPHPDTDQLRSVLKHFRTATRRSHWPLRIESTRRLPLTPHGKFDAAAAKQQERKVNWRQTVSL